MQTVEVRRVKTAVVTALTCDKCNTQYDITETIEVQEFLRVRFTGGYAAVLGDGSSYELDLCQYCVKDLLGPYLRDVTHDY